MKLRTVEEAFWKNVNKSENGCWSWTIPQKEGARGCPRICLNNKHKTIKDASYEIHFGVIPDGYKIVSICDNNLCVRPDHLSLMGTDLKSIFLSYTEQKEDGCLIWKQEIMPSGYGIFTIRTSNCKEDKSAHVFSYELFKGTIPDGYSIVHTCDVKACVAPDHLLLESQEPSIQFWKYVNKQEGDQCWLWTRGFSDTGYGQFAIDDKACSAHRVAYILTYGEIPDGLLVCHTCDNRACVRPDHMFLGTHQDNTNDMIAKGRQRHVGNRSKAKLAEEDVREIRRLLSLGVHQKVIASQFNVTRSAITSINRGVTWSDV